MDGTESPLSLKDLSLLMEAYKNNIALSTTLLEQEKQVIQQQDEIIDKLNKVCESIVDAQKNSNDKVKDINTIQNETLNAVKKIDTGMLMEFETRTSSIKALIYGSYVGMITIIISLIGLIIVIVDKIK
jgi:hypothetical protein